MGINYVVGNATEPLGSGPRIIVHICNDIGGWGRGFVGALSSRWSAPERFYRRWARGEDVIPFEVGQVQLVSVDQDLWVANLIGQHGIQRQGGQPPIRYDALRAGLQRVAQHAQNLGASLHMPRIGTGLAAGTWDNIAPLIEDELISKGIDVTVYDLPTGSPF